MLVHEYRQIIQDPDMSDSDMMEHIRHMLAGGYDLVEYKWDGGLKHWVFMKLVDAEPVALNVFGLKAEA
jgi:hypothetical protein